MNAPLPVEREQNPFSANRLRPGRISFIFDHGQSLNQLLERLKQSEWRGQIVGPHGTGKSTLLAALLPAIERMGLGTLLVTLHDSEANLPAEFRDRLHKARNAVAAIDGFEQLRPWHRSLLKRYCRRHGLGLVVASHRTAGLPELYRTGIDVSRAWHVVEKFQDGYAPYIKLSDLVERLARHRGNLREALFDLYDLYEDRRK